MGTNFQSHKYEKQNKGNIFFLLKRRAKKGVNYEKQNKEKLDNKNKEERKKVEVENKVEKKVEKKEKRKV